MKEPTNSLRLTHIEEISKRVLQLEKDNYYLLVFIALLSIVNIIVSLVTAVYFVRS